MTKFLNISIDNTLGGNSASDDTVSSQKAIKEYIDAHSSGSPSWGSITGTLSNQTDLQNTLNDKQDTLVSGTNIKTINGSTILGSGDLSISSRNIGEIIQSTIPLSDAGLHLLDGSLISGSGSYSAFVTYVAGLVSSYPDLFETEANWQNSVTTYGVCGKFVYDSVNNTVRLPKITGFTEGTIDPTVLGDLVEAGLPNITGYNSSTYLPTTESRTSGAISRYSSGDTGANYGSTSSTAYGYGFNLDASLSNSIYGNSTTVQPQAIKVLYYIVIATSVKTNIEVDIDDIATDLNGKADVDLSNLSNGLTNTICTTPATTLSSASTAQPAVVVENYVNGVNWYRIWSDGWIEQGGGLHNTVSGSNGATTVAYLKKFANTNYTLVTNVGYNSSSNQSCYRQPYSKTVSGFTYNKSSDYIGNWHACGY